MNLRTAPYHNTPNEIYIHALKLLRARDCTVLKLREKLEAKFGSAPQEVIDRLVQNQFLSDRRFAESYVAKHKIRGLPLLREELLARGVSAAVANEILSQIEWPSLKDALAAKMKNWKLCVPLGSRDAARLFRALLRLGYDEDSIREEIDPLHE